MYWWQSQKRGGTAAPAAAAGVGGGAAAAGEVTVQKVHNLVPKPTFHHGKLNKLESIKEDINKAADEFIQRIKARLFKQGKSFRATSTATPPPAGRDGHLV